MSKLSGINDDVLGDKNNASHWQMHSATTLSLWWRCITHLVLWLGLSLAPFPVPKTEGAHMSMFAINAFLGGGIFAAPYSGNIQTESCHSERMSCTHLVRPQRSNGENSGRSFDSEGA